MASCLSLVFVVCLFWYFSCCVLCLTVGIGLLFCGYCLWFWCLWVLVVRIAVYVGWADLRVLHWWILLSCCLVGCCGVVLFVAV